MGLVQPEEQVTCRTPSLTSETIFTNFQRNKFIIADTEYNLQKAAYKLNQIITEYGLNISVQKTKSTAFKGCDPVRTKIVIDNNITQQVPISRPIRRTFFPKNVT